ncbi:putative RNA-directed DNA polymerase from mobile element jockey-like [Apostichopus japonicus]|uniref:Putative RNA-directed DNA polymerase from mobile element jockey-like n=1 Tax=Stichopus japonicus TaxID=307972 RepID=A0A2G8KSB6_STIJA|nr:putative RNA-directed DNA polymerase from mobile element jockey-like [Apostichopus japonicus]
MEVNIPKSFGSRGRRKPVRMTGRAVAKKKASMEEVLEKLRIIWIYRRYGKLRNQARWETRRAKSDFEKKIATEVKKNTKVFWSYTRSKTIVRQPVHDLLVEGSNAKVTSAKGKADALNEFFCSVFTSQDLASIPHVDKQNYANILDNVEIIVEKVLQKLCNLKITKAQGPDGIPPRILYELREEVAPALAKIFKMSLSYHSLPSDWKVAYVAPLFKKGSRSSPGNYRPVSLMSVVFKVCESLLRDSVVAHMNRNDFFSTGQYGFISGKSCVTQLIDVLDDWTKSLDDGSGIDVVYTGFMKAFDKVPHERLLAKVRSYGNTGDLLQWIRQFLYRRKQREGSLSDWADITSGIPQGSVLGRILFLLYINDLPCSVAGCSVKIFADDTKLYKAVHSLRDCDVLQNNIDNM